MARTDPQLRAHFRTAERRARRHLDRVVNDLVAPIKDHPGYSTLVMLTTAVLRGFALAGVLRSDPVLRAQLLDGWFWAIRILLEQ